MTRAQKIAKARRKYLNALAGGTRDDAKQAFREYVREMRFQIRAENKQDRKRAA